MSASLLRRAAAKLREHAGKATPGSWSADPTGTVCADADLRPDGQGGEVLPEGGPMEVAECYRNERAGERGDNAAFIALMHPPVALALAELLEVLATEQQTSNPFDLISAESLARAILREPS